ncbi:MAG: hypothetical protein ASARMPREDX12_008269 [Alectoria sarmentosa]|nr:MAG: hypothetical protein ASARMPREDX12_008269 [Alectoria sarmentosa]
MHAASPRAPGLDLRQVVNCTDLEASFDSSCWNTLNLGEYLNDPEIGWNRTAAICTGDEDDSACCLPTEPWTTCYLRLAHGFPGTDCSEINAQDCSYDPSLAVDPRIAPYVAYTMKTIYAINDLFTTWYNALQYAASQALSIVQDVINQVDPPQQTNFILRDLLFALTVGLAYVVAPEAGSLTGLLVATATAGRALLKGANQAPTVARGIWPAGTESSQSIQIGDVENELNNATGISALMLNSGLELLMSDMPSFVEFASTGMFSGSDSFSLSKEVDGLDVALKTFIVSNAMTSNGWHYTVNLGPTRDDIASCIPGSGGSCCTWWALNSSSSNPSMCGDFIWYSDTTMRAFTLTNPNVMNGSVDMLNAIVEKEWTTLPLLFDGAYNCSAAGNFGGAPIQIEADGTIDLSCMSQLAEGPSLSRE